MLTSLCRSCRYIHVLVLNCFGCADGDVDAAGYGDVDGEYGSDGETGTAGVGLITAGGKSLILLLFRSVV